MSCYSSGAEWIALVADVAQICGLVGIYLAYRALTTWRGELRASTESQAALETLAAVRILRDAIQTYRRPFREMHELVINFSQSDMERRVLVQRAELYLDPAIKKLREAEVRAIILWDTAIGERLEALTSCVSELRHYSEEYLRRLLDYPSGPMIVGHRDRQGEDDEGDEVSQNPFYKQARDVVLEPAATTGPDEFGAKVASAVAGLEDFLRPRLATFIQEDE